MGQYQGLLPKGHSLESLRLLPYPHNTGGQEVGLERTVLLIPCPTCLSVAVGNLELHRRNGNRQSRIRPDRVRAGGWGAGGSWSPRLRPRALSYTYRLSLKGMKPGTP